MLLVSAQDFVDRMRELIVSRLDDEPDLSPIGLYAEREMMHRAGKVVDLFKQPKRPVRTASGAGPKAVSPKLPWVQDVGSEGLVAQLITELSREHPGRVFSHPGPHVIRKRKIRRFIVVSDFVGSGRRVNEYLTAAWQVWSVRSWWSARASNGLRFEVAAYSSTEAGHRTVEAHPCAPQLNIVSPCPTITSTFDEYTAELIKSLCIDRDPIKPDPVASLGYRGTGALIAFSHGAPNNVPRFFTDPSAPTKAPQYFPLFPKRITADSRASFASGVSSSKDVRAALELLGQRRLAHARLPGELDAKQGQALLLLAALARPPRTTMALAGRTGLTVIEVEAQLGRIREFGWIDTEKRLTDKGQAQLRQARKRVRVKQPVPNLPTVYYYPTSLRAPVGPSSDAG